MAPLHNANWPSHLRVITRWIHTSTDHTHTHTHTHTEQPPAWVGWRAESTSAIPERHPALQKDTHTHAHTFWASGAHGQIGTVVKLAPSL